MVCVENRANDIHRVWLQQDCNRQHSPSLLPSRWYSRWIKTIKPLNVRWNLGAIHQQNLWPLVRHVFKYRCSFKYWQCRDFSLVFHIYQPFSSFLNIWIIWVSEDPNLGGVDTFHTLNCKDNINTQPYFIQNMRFLWRGGIEEMRLNSDENWD